MKKPISLRPCKGTAVPFLVLCLSMGLTKAVTSDIESRVHEYDLKNGLHVIVYVDSSAPVVNSEWNPQRIFALPLNNIKHR